MPSKNMHSIILMLIWCYILNEKPNYVSSSEVSDELLNQQQNIRHSRSRLHFARSNRRSDHTMRFVENFLDKTTKTRSFSALTAFDSMSFVADYNTSGVENDDKFAYANENKTDNVNKTQMFKTKSNITSEYQTSNYTDLEYSKFDSEQLDQQQEQPDGNEDIDGEDEKNFVSEENILLDHTTKTEGTTIRTGNVDIVTRFLRIVESQHLLGENCTAGTDLNLGEGVVDRYAQERFRIEADVAVNRANMLTRLWKYADPSVVMSEYLLHASVFSMVEFDDDIFAAGNCYDQHQYKDYWLFCPYAYRLPEGPILVKDLAVEYKYLSNTSEWFYIARKNAENVIRNYNQFSRGEFY